MNFKLILGKFLTENKSWFKFALQWFAVAAVLGAIAFFVRPDLISKVVDMFRDKFGAAPAQNLDLAKQIFLQNSLACLLALLGGVIFGISSFVILFFNGFIIGLVVMSLVLIPGNPARNLLYIIAGLLPHGIFELPAFFVASALGMRAGTEWLLKASAGRRGQVFAQNLKRILYIIPVLEILLVIAALVEVFVSGRLISGF